MAVLKAPAQRTGLKIEETAPKGSFLAVCISVDDQFQVERRKFESQETELQDVTTFYFGLKDKAGKKFVAPTKEMKISGHEKAGLVKFLKAWNGEPFPYGTDYVKWGVGKGAQIVIEHRESKKYPGKFYATVTGIQPVMDGLEPRVPKASEFAEFLSAPAEASEASGSKAAHNVAAADDDEDNKPF